MNEIMYGHIGEFWNRYTKRPFSSLGLMAEDGDQTIRAARNRSASWEGARGGCVQSRGDSINRCTRAEPTQSRRCNRRNASWEQESDVLVGLDLFDDLGDDRGGAMGMASREQR